MPVHIQTGVGDLRTPRASPMTPDQMRGVAARLRGRAKSALSKDHPERHRDLLTAASLVDQLVELRVVIRSAEAVAHRLHSLFKLAGGC
jgi:hypothetical protein